MTTSSHQGNATRYAGTSARNATLNHSVEAESGTNETSQFSGSSRTYESKTVLADTLMLFTLAAIIALAALIGLIIGKLT